jgi:hypothetical protein
LNLTGSCCVVMCIDLAASGSSRPVNKVSIINLLIFKNPKVYSLCFAWQSHRDHFVCPCDMLFHILSCNPVYIRRFSHLVYSALKAICQLKKKKQKNFPMP